MTRNCAGANFFCIFCKRNTHLTDLLKTAPCWNVLYQKRREYMKAFNELNTRFPLFRKRFFGHLPISGDWRKLALLPAIIHGNHHSIWRMFMFFAIRQNLRFNPTSLANYVGMNPRLMYSPTDRNIPISWRMLAQYCHFSFFETLVSRMALPMVPMPRMSTTNLHKLRQNLMKMMWKKILQVIASKVSWNLCI
jgi:hypothetical protein